MNHISQPHKMIGACPVHILLATAGSLKEHLLSGCQITIPVLASERQAYRRPHCFHAADREQVILPE
jgi:hypothetical protein